MNAKLIIFFAIVAAVYSTEEPKRVARDVLLAAGPTAWPYEIVHPSGKYPINVDPVKCPNWPICDSADFLKSPETFVRSLEAHAGYYGRGLYGGYYGYPYLY